MRFTETPCDGGSITTIVLTFAIPTFNRLECLKMLVGSLIEQIATINLQRVRLELLICNNASTDDTAAYLETLADIRNVKVITHAENLGGDANIAYCFESAKGRYVWICGDDDLPLPGTIEKVIDFLEKESIDLLYLPAEWHSGDLRPYLRQLPKPGIFVPINSMSLAFECNAYVTFISSWVVNRYAYYASPANAGSDRYAGTFLAQLEWQLTLMAHGKKFFTSKCRWVIARGGNSNGYSLFDVFVTNYCQIIDEKFRFHPELRQFFRNFMLRSYLPGLIWGLRHEAIGNFGDLDQNKLQAIIKAGWPDDWLFVALLKPISQLPKPLAKIVFSFSWIYCKLWLVSLARKKKNGVDE